MRTLNLLLCGLLTLGSWPAPAGADTPAASGGAGLSYSAGGGLTNSASSSGSSDGSKGGASGDYTAVCAPIDDHELHVLKTPSPTPSQAASPFNVSKDYLTQKTDYCHAAKVALQGMDANKTLQGVWMAVAGACALPCFGVAAAGLVCDVGAGYGVLEEITISHNLMGLVQGLMGGVMMGAMSGGGGMSLAGKKGGCMLMGFALTQVMAKYQGQQASQQAFESALKNAISLVDNRPSAVTGGTSDGTTDGTNGPTGRDPFTPVANPTGDGTGRDPGGITSGSVTADTGGKSSGSDCAKAHITGDTGAAIACAIATDKNVPGFVSNPNFPRDVERATGLPLADVLKNGAPPGGAAGLGNYFGGGNGRASDIGNALAALSPASMGDANLASMGADVPGGAFSGGGAGGGAGAGEVSAENPLGTLMAGLLGALGPKGPTQPQDKNLVEVAKASLQRGPASLAEDRTLSIFARISFRYAYVGRRILGMPEPDFMYKPKK